MKFVGYIILAMWACFWISIAIVFLGVLMSMFSFMNGFFK